MPEVKGPLTTLNHVIPAGLDASRMLLWKLRGGSTYGEVRAQIGAALDGANQEFLNTWGDLIYITENDFFEYPNGGAVTDYPDITELDRVDPYKGSTVGHMADLRVKGGAIGATERYFRDVRPEELNATIYDHVQRARNTFEKALLTRAMTTTANALGTSGFDVGWANASSGVSYTPPAFGGQAFTSSHTHYLGVNVSTPKTAGDLLNALAGAIAEHGIDGPYKVYVSEADVALYTALTTGFIQLVAPTVMVIDRGGATTGPSMFTTGIPGATTPTGGRLIGYFQSNYGLVGIYATNRLPTGYAFMYKSYGQNDPRNPIAVRVHPDVGFGLHIKEIPSNDSTWPVKRIELEMEYGITANRNRLAGAAGFLVAGGAFVNPSIS